ncbi:uncharacterized protein LOC114253243 [Bombyx mandarina]|uniref:Uncharacterized protein LOC114253243 n=1 Tax=Bombyx mandarina TaxID=7092 RepID=A0A6J2KS76_BOMMA|nr:uncharacterized protein LOC114253243 [Bombyx mandarina]
MPNELVQIFKYWYANQLDMVRWSGVYSRPYRMECGVRQGGLTSPKLFKLYVSTHVGCHIDEIYLNSISYADDIMLLSASACGLSKLLGICERYALSHGLVYNANKSECMVFRAKSRCLDNIPAVKLNGTPLRRVDKFKYLGYFIASDLRDGADIEWEQRALSLRANINMIARSQKQYSALRVQYNNAFRVLLGLPRFCSASGIFAEARVDCFFTTMRKRCTSLIRRVQVSPNSILKTVMNVGT